MLIRKCAKVLLFISIFTIVTVWQVNANAQAKQESLAYEQMQERARASQGSSGIKEEIVDTFVNQDWKGLFERSVKSAEEEAAEVTAMANRIAGETEKQES